MARRPDLTPDELERIAELREGRASQREIARQIGCSVGSVSWALLKLGIDIDPDAPLPPVPTEPTQYARGGMVVRRFTEAEDARLLELEASGAKVYHIAKLIGRQNNSVLGRLRTLARREARAEGGA
jgi:hypothetical protein